ncbi:MAG: prepilin-type N-terminal cleavage/methylation domain-containing protein [Planctomycetes bacterium]|nr:prepilin-type N-terminal cleavage/methylation domain-containing protein [Planctomycetota bacterium]
MNCRLRLKSGVYFQRGFTLIELLAVIVIVSLTVGIATIGLAASTESAEFHATVSQLKTLDAQARAFSRNLGSLTIQVNPQQQGVELYVNNNNELLKRITLAKPITVQIVTERQVNSITFDSFGRSVDYDIQITTSSRSITWHVNGLTGYIIDGKAQQ